MWGITSVQWGITSVLWRVFSTVWERIFILACLVINNDEEISHYDAKFSFRSFSKIQGDFMPFESWTGVLQVQPCFEVIDNFISLLNLTVTAGDIHSFLNSVISFKFTKMPLKLV